MHDQLADFAAMQQQHLLQCWGEQATYAPVEVAHTEGCWMHTRDGRKNFSTCAVPTNASIWGFATPESWKRSKNKWNPSFM